MKSQRREWLLILDEASADAVLPQLRALVSVTHVVSPRVIVVSSERDPVSALSPILGVRRMYADDVSAEEIESDEAFMALNREESLAARAWLWRQQQPEKQRPGEGLAWDAEGFEPP
jgi:hypothetical protein